MPLIPPPPPPDPERATACGLLLAESVNVRVAERVPDAEGLNTTPTVQLAPDVKLVPHVLLTIVKSAALVPATLMLPIEMVEPLPFFNVAVCVELLDPTLTEPNESEEGLTVAPAVPRPESATVCGLVLSVSLKLSVAVRVPVVVGANTMFTVQLAAAARLVPQVLLKIWKSPGFAPVNPMLLMVTAALLPLVRVTTFWPPLFPTGTDTQLRLVGDAETAAKALSAKTCAKARGADLRTKASTAETAKGPDRLRMKTPYRPSLNNLCSMEQINRDVRRREVFFDQIDVSE